LDYHPISEALLTLPGHRQGGDSIILLTEYKDIATFLGREKLFDSIREQLPGNTPGVLPAANLFEIVEWRLFLDVPAEGDGARMKLLAKQ